MVDTGYFELDRLPSRCASNYIYDSITNSYRTNIYCTDVKGTGAGGAFITVDDIMLFWQNLLSYKLLSRSMTENMLAKHSQEDEEDAYGYGIWLKIQPNGYRPYFQGCDPGVSFITTYDFTKQALIVIVSNYEDNVWRLNRKILESID